MAVYTMSALVGIDGTEDKKSYRVITWEQEDLADGKVRIGSKYGRRSLDELGMINAMSTSRFINCELKRLNAPAKIYKVVGKGASLSRFNSNKKHRPFVIISQIMSTSGKLLGFKVANYEGNVKSITLKEMVAFGERLSKAEEIPIQNAVYVPTTGAKVGHFKSYAASPFLVEVVNTGKNDYAEKRKLNPQNNKKSLLKATEIFNDRQIKELQLGKQKRLDIRVYANPSLSAEQMHELREGMEKGINVRSFAFPEYTPDAMRMYVLDLENKQDIRQYLSPKYNIEQLFQLSLAVEEGVDISKISNPKMPATDMEEIRERLRNDLWKDWFVNEQGLWR